MGFELITGWTADDPAPVALCDNPACANPLMPTAGWVIANVRSPDPARPGPPRAIRTYLACGDACLAAVREGVGGQWSAPVRYEAFWRAISPLAQVTGACPADDAPPAVTLAYRRAEWQQIAASLAQRQAGPVADFIRAGLAFAPGAAKVDPTDPIAFPFGAAQAAAVQAAAADLGIDVAAEDPDMAACSAAVAVAEALIRHHQRRARG